MSSTFKLDANMLNSTIPSQLGQLALTEELLLFNNSLISTVPTELGELSDMSVDFQVRAAVVWISTTIKSCNCHTTARKLTDNVRS